MNFFMNIVFHISCWSKKVIYFSKSLKSCSKFFLMII
nr:MAG TPA: hypothetical protein [Caudoviricetes sp.]